MYTSSRLSFLNPPMAVRDVYKRQEYYYARMARLGPEGTREVIYDVGQAFETRANTIFVMIMCGIGGGLAYAVYSAIDQRRRYRVYAD